MIDISIQYQHSASIKVYYRDHQLEPAKYFSGLQQIVIFDYINQQSTSVEYCKKILYCSVKKFFKHEQLADPLEQLNQSQDFM